MTAAGSSYKGFRFPPEIISHCVWLYHRFPLSFRDVQELMLERGVDVSYETIRPWWTVRAGVRKLAAPSGPRPGDRWHLDEVSSRSAAHGGTCGARSTSTATCSTFWSSRAETRWPQRSSSADCSRACGACPG